MLLGVELETYLQLWAPDSAKADCCILDMLVSKELTYGLNETDGSRSEEGTLSEKKWCLEATLRFLIPGQR